MSDIILTIAIPSIPSRIRMNLEPLFSRLMAQVGSRKDVEIISLLDNKMMTNSRKNTGGQNKNGIINLMISASTKNIQIHNKIVVKKFIDPFGVCMNTSHSGSTMDDTTNFI